MTNFTILRVKGPGSGCPEEWSFPPEDLQNPPVHWPGFSAQHDPAGAGGTRGAQRSLHNPTTDYHVNQKHLS